MTDTNIYDNNIGENTKDSTLQECMTRCDMDERCKAISYVTKGHENSLYHGNCLMKTQNLESKDLHQAVIGVVSANKKCFSESGKSLSGGRGVQVPKYVHQ